ncbi:hypothetical protein B5X24_HaOG217063 [Helicoverpa armigera]|uniref:Uncharacterized protein n=1 Tax=Helicoverpa armigera TaxID=29058 RepID=A0A2W1BV68_HELAM|nr:hypothetical protein B5X24_HaOG217063 [Helicoverpa armigera]
MMGRLKNKTLSVARGRASVAASLSSMYAEPEATAGRRQCHTERHTDRSPRASTRPHIDVARDINYYTFLRYHPYIYQAVLTPQIQELH